MLVARTDPGETAVSAEESQEPLLARRLTSPVLVGRAKELRLLREAACSSPTVALVEGEAGLGKTRLITELLALPELHGRRVLVGRSHRIREPFPLGPVIDAVRALRDDLPRLELTPLAGALRPLLPELAWGLPSAPEALRDAAAERHRVFRALAEVLGAASPALVVLEDLHWADDQTLEFLGFLTWAQPDGLSLVLSFRPEDAPPGLGAPFSRLPPETPSVRIELSPLDEERTGELAAAILGTEAISPEFAALLRERTGGIPFALEEVLALLQDRKDLRRRHGRWERRALEELEVPGAIRDSVLERAGRLDPAARGALEAAAVLQDAAPESVLLAVSGLGGSEASPALSEAIASGLLEEREGGIGFRHVLPAQAVYEALPGPRRRELHDRAARALEAVDPPPLGRLAHHLRGAGRTEEWAGVAEQAADRAVEVGDDAGAAGLLRDVLTEAPLDADGRVRVALKLGRAALQGLAHDRAAHLLSVLLDDEELPTAVRGELRLELALLLDQSGDPAGCYEHLKGAVAELEERPDRQAEALAALAVVTVHRVPVRENLAWMTSSLQALRKAPDPVLEARVLGNRAALLITIGDEGWGRAVEDLPTREGSPEYQRERARVAHNIAATASHTGYYAAAEAALTEGRAICAGGASERARRFLDATQVFLDFNLGRWEGLHEAIATVSRELLHLPLHLVEVEFVAACLALARGDLAGARSGFERLLPLTERHCNQTLGPIAGGLARLHLAHGDAARTASTAMEAVALLEGMELWAPAGPAVRWAVEALVASSREHEAQALVRRFAAGLLGKDAPVGAAALRVCCGVLAEAGGRPEEAARSFLSGAAAYAHLPCPYEAAQANERAALCLFPIDEGRAASILSETLKTFHELGASWDAARCARAARSHGLTVPAPYRGGRRGYGDALSPREEEVARLVAAGHTNKEIAAVLFLSASTVKKHVGGAMRKLGVGSRRAVARHLRT